MYKAINKERKKPIFLGRNRKEGLVNMKPEINYCFASDFLMASFSALAEEGCTFSSFARIMA